MPRTPTSTTSVATSTDRHSGPPLTVIGGNVPLSVPVGNGVGAPLGFLIAASVLLLFSVGFVTMTAVEDAPKEVVD